MTEKYITYKLGEKIFDVPESQSANVERDYPDATIEMRMGDRVFDVPLSHKQDVINQYGSELSYVYDKELSNKANDAKMSFEEPEDTKASFAAEMPTSKKADDDDTSIRESAGKGLGAGLLGVVKGAWDLLVKAGAGSYYIDPHTGIAERLPTYDEMVKEGRDEIKWSQQMGKTVDRLRKEADPAHSEKGYGELLKEGKIGMAAQKALAQGAESLPAMVAIGTGPVGMLAYGSTLAASEYADQAVENPEIEAWKRGVYSVGSAATEVLVEKIGGPLKNILGKGGKELTEEAARELLERVSREGTETIAKRIFKGLGKTLKEGAEEGGEEVLTAFGNDALGMALDAIDGDKDYGLNAQWERYKAENPDADKMDFAKAKGKEYWESFLGGALSGMEISGTVESAKAISNKKRSKSDAEAIQEARDAGSKMDYANMYDLNSDVSDATDAVSNAFVNENGESAISREFIGMMSSEESLALARRADLSVEQRANLAKLAEFKAVQEGLNEKLDKRIESELNARNITIKRATENGSVITALLNGRNVFVKGGVITNDARIVTPFDTDGPVTVIDMETGEETTANSKDLIDAGSMNAEQYAMHVSDAIVQQDSKFREEALNTMSPRAKMKAIEPYVGKKMLIDLGKGIVEVGVQQILPKRGAVLIKGKKGDLGGKAMVELGADVFYDALSRDDAGNPMFAEGEIEADEAIAETPQETAFSEEVDFRDSVVPILINGIPVNVDVQSQDNTANRIVYRYTDENGQQKTGTSTIEEFNTAYQQAKEYQPEDEITPEVPTTEDTTTEEVATEVPISEETTVEPAPTDVPTEITPTAEEINWDALFEQDAEAYFTELTNQFGEESSDILNEEIEAAQEELDSLTKKRGKTQNERLANRQKKVTLQNRIDILNGMVGRLTPVTEQATEAPVEQVAEAVEEAPAQSESNENIPDVSVDKATDARERGFRVTNGQRVNRRSEAVGAYGDDIEVAFTADSKGKRAGKVKVIDAADLIPSHISGVENVEHFLPEAQPKKRTDTASTVSASLIAQNMNNPQMTNVVSSAYEGAPIINKRGEVIQGNNRSAAIKEMYQSHANKASEYKQYLIDHASEYGLNPDEIAAMQNPVLVREIDATDEDAINLGQYTMQDMESGGNQLIDASRAITGLNNKDMMEQFAAVLLYEENGEASDMNLSDLVIKNGNDALKLLYAQGIINQTQYQSALGADGRLTADAKAAMRDIIEQQLFTGGIDNLSIMFEVLPDKAKKAIMQTIVRDLKNPEGEKVVPYIQEAIELYYHLNQQADFVAAKKDAEIKAAIESYAHQTSFDEVGIPAEKYSNFAFVLAWTFKSLKQTDQRAKFNQLYDTMAGASDLFAENTEGKSLSEAVNEVYNATLNKESNETNGQSGDRLLEDDTRESDGRRQASSGGLGVRPEDSSSEGTGAIGGADSSVNRGTESETAEVAPVAPNPVKNPTREAQKREKSLATQLKRVGVSPEQKQDMAFNAGKAVGDFFATREEYDAYAENATDLGDYNANFERGVDKSFANRPHTESMISADNLDGTSTEAKKLATDAVLEILGDTVIKATDEQAQTMLDIRDELSDVELMTVYHGSGSKFDKFDHSHMGEGEGAQAHGWGTYVAVNSDTSKAYGFLGTVSYVGPKLDYGSTSYDVVQDIVSIMNHRNDFEEAINIGRRLWNNLKWEPSHREKRAILDTLKPEDFKLRSLYTVEIPEDDGSNYYSEGILTNEECDRLIAAGEKEGIDIFEIVAKVTANDTLTSSISTLYPDEGRRIYREIAKKLGSDKAASEFLSRAGFVGIKYNGRIDGECYVIFNESDAKITDRVEFYQTPNGTVYGWTDGKKIYLTEAGINPNTPVHEYTHLWARAMMQKNPKGWNSIKKLLRGTPVWNEVLNDPNYSSIRNDEDAVASEVLSRISGTKNAAKLEKMAQQMIDEAKGTMRKLEARGLVQRIKDALNEFWSWVGTELFGIEKFESVEQVTDRVLWDLMNKTDLGELSEGQVETQIVTNPIVIAELESSPKRTGFRNVVQNEDGTFSSPMAYWLQSTKEGAKSRVETAKFELGKWEEAEEHPELVDDNGKVTLVKPNKGTIANVAYDPYIHNRLEPVNLQFKDAWKREDLVYVETEVAENDLNDGYHADKALLPVGVHSWSNGDVMLSRYDKPVRVMPWDEVADAWVDRLNGEGVNFDVVPPALRNLLVERGVEILPPHKGMGKDCNDAYAEWKKENPQSDPRDKSTSPSPKVESNQTTAHAQTKDAAKIAKSIETLKELSQRSRNERVTSPDKIVNYLADALNITIKKGETKNTSKRNKYVLPSGETLSVRVSKHNVSARTYIEFNFNQKYNLAITFKSVRDRNNFRADDNVRLDEYVYFTERVRQYNGSVLSEVALSLANFLETGIYEDTTSLAIVNTSPTGAQPRTKENYSSEILSRRTDIQSASVNFLAGDARLRAIENAVNEEAAKLGVTVTYKTREEMPKGHKNDKGYYNTKTGEIVICTENAVDINDAIQTILHEAVAHKGLRQLMGDRFNEFINRVYESLNAETKAKVDTLAERYYKGNKAVAMEEYMASLAESEDFAKTSIWEKIKDIFNDIINRILNRNDIKIGDNELRYILRASYANMVNPHNMETIEGWAKDTRMREEYKINEASPEILSRTGIDPTEVAGETAKAVYDTQVGKTWQEVQRQFQDAYQPVRIAIDAIQQETGNVPIEDYENYLLIQNQSSSRSRVEIDLYIRNYYSPLVEEVNGIINGIMEARGFKVSDKAMRAEVYKEVRQYLIAKHGLERNAYYQNSKGEMRDYSGLTALFGMDAADYVAAEAEAQNVVDAFENEVDTTELWKKINAATDKTLRHSYESGLISRQQYNDIKAMFNYYIPLRGFDETTAEDVYAYARFEGNRFNPVNKKTEGRTSLADDPLAIIMNMAESEIAQGNKNRAKQALYNYLLNRLQVGSDGSEVQNSLMQIQSVWYYKNPDGTCTIATPNHDTGETYEEFENRMKVLEASDQAFKSKKGQVDVGMRFQKKANKDAHYIYLKVNGVDKAIFVNGDPRAANAINGADRKEDGDVTKVARSINRILSSTFTNYSLEFTARNYFRDMMYSHINIAVKESDPAYRKKFRKNWRHNNLGTMVKMLKAYRAGEFDGRPLNEDEAAFVEFMNNGGQTGYTLINSVERHKADLERAIKSMRKGIEKGGIKDSTAFKYSLGAIEALNEASELVTRFAAFKTSRDMGRSIEKSVSDAKEITVNFNTKGAQDGKGILGSLTHYLGWSKFFFNASVQGVQNIAAMAKANYLKFGTVVGGIFATGLLMPVITAALSELLGGDDDENEYWNIPEWERQNNICMPIGKGLYAKIPLPVGISGVYALGDMIAAMAWNKKFTRDAWQVGTDMANKITSMVLPINPLESSANGLSLWQTGALTLAPSSAHFIIQNANNIDWKGAPLQKEYTFNADDPQWMKAYASNPEWMVSLSKWCNENLGAGDMDGWDWSPEKLDNTLSNLGGGIYGLIKKTGRGVKMIWNEENRNLTNVPLASVALGSGIDDDDRTVTSAYYEMKGYYDQRKKFVETRAEKFGYDLDDVFKQKKGQHHPKMQEVYGSGEFEFMREWYLGNKGLEKINRDIKKLEKEIAGKENPSEALLNRLEKEKTKLAVERRKFVDKMIELD